jgi:aminoglycoside phosphotransferase (APT) family kinase protein
MHGDTRQFINAIHRLAGSTGSDKPAELNRLPGGVSSDIWKVQTAEHAYCVKQALERLNVEAEWHAPVERNRFEVRWNEMANRAVPGSAPAVRYHDDTHMFFIMDYLDPARYPLWKDMLRDGLALPADAENVARALGRIHAAAAGKPEIAALFPRTDIFHDIRLEPYLVATGARHPDLKDHFETLCRETAATRLTLIHGDVSPKNILIGPSGPVFLDAECACIGDPAFDLAFCLNHMLLKCLWRPAYRERYLACFDALTRAYLSVVDWEPPAVLEGRAAALLPALFLARVDGKSPVEYLTGEPDRERVRHAARDWITARPGRLAFIRAAWRDMLNA